MGGNASSASQCYLGKQEEQKGGFGLGLEERQGGNYSSQQEVGNTDRIYTENIENIHFDCCSSASAGQVGSWVIGISESGEQDHEWEELQGDQLDCCGPGVMNPSTKVVEMGNQKEELRKTLKKSVVIET